MHDPIIRGMKGPHYRMHPLRESNFSASASSQLLLSHISSALRISDHNIEVLFIEGLPPDSEAFSLYTTIKDLECMGPEILAQPTGEVGVIVAPTIRENPRSAFSEKTMRQGSWKSREKPSFTSKGRMEESLGDPINLQNSRIPGAADSPTGTRACWKTTFTANALEISYAFPHAA